MILNQLNPSIPVITPKGKALAIAIVDYGMENDMQWVCFQDDTGECWSWKNPQIRAQKNITQGRDYISPFYNPDDVSFNYSVCNKCGEYKNECTCGGFIGMYKSQAHMLKIAALENEINIHVQEKSKLKEKINDLERLMRNLINDDQIYPTERKSVNETLDKLQNYDE